MDRHLDLCANQPYLIAVNTRRNNKPLGKLISQWQLSPAATLGSSVRAKGILLEIRARLPLAQRKLLDLEAGTLTLRAPEDAQSSFKDTAAIVSELLRSVESQPVIPREAEDILTISAAERHRWIKDGRLASAGTRTVKLRGRARKITFHVFDPRHIEDLLDRDMASVWREEDALVAKENRRRAAWKAARTRAAKLARDRASPSDAALEGWDEFSLDGLLR